MSVRVLKGFVSHLNYTNNKPNVISPFGEISTDALTYATDVATYVDANDDNIVLHSFTSKMGDQNEMLNLEHITHVFKIAKYIYDEVAKRSNNWLEEIQALVLDAFPNEVNKVKVGKIVIDTERNLYCPEWISWEALGFDSKFQIKIWFADYSFRKRYDDFSIKVVNALPNVDDFYLTHDEVKAKVDEQSPTVINERVELTKNKQPPTITRALEYDWHDRFSDKKIRTTWYVIIHGKAGDNIDAIKDAIVDDVLDKSTYSEEEWKKLFPDLFKRTEFIFVPQWDVMAIENRTVEKGIYSPVIQLKGLKDKVKPYFDKYPDSHLDEYMATMGHPYRSLGLTFCSGYENRDAKYKLSDVFPDYIAEHSLVEDFNRMTKRTKRWAEMLHEMIIHAEQASLYSEVPEGFARVKREGKWFISKSYEHIHYLVAMKENFFPNDDEE